jgi:hypothetical protein
MRRLVLAAFLAGCGGPAAQSPAPRPKHARVAPAPRRAQPPAPGSQGGSVTPPSPPVDPAAALEEALAPVAGDSLLLLGIHGESIESFFPMFSSEGRPRTDVRPGYRTLVIEVKGGDANVVGILPYVAVPQPAGFLYVGEASVSIHLPFDPSVTLENGEPKPRDYDATEIWTTRRPKEIPAIQKKREQELKKKRAWGTEQTAQIVYLTQSAMCAAHTWSEVTGGALYFFASTHHELTSLDDRTIPKELAAVVDEPTFLDFASQLYEVAREDIDLDRPFSTGIDTVVWRDDITPCLDHHRGGVTLLGSALFSGNSARRYLRSAPVMPAPANLAPGHGTVDFDAIEKAIPGVIDAFVSPTRDVVLAVRAEENQPVVLVVWDVAGHREVKTLPMPGRPVMEEWSAGETAAGWITTLTPFMARPTPSGS